MNNLRSKSAFGTAKPSMTRLSTSKVDKKMENSTSLSGAKFGFGKPITVDNNAISQGTISMKDKIKRSTSNAAFQ